MGASRGPVVSSSRMKVKAVAFPKGVTTQDTCCSDEQRQCVHKGFREHGERPNVMDVQ